MRGSTAGIQRRLGNVEARIVFCGHSHLPHLIQLPDGPLILNPGSVGLPAYDDLGADEPHVSESGSPHARYAVLTIDDDQVSVEMIALNYPWEIAAEQAERNGRHEWAHALRTGFMPRPV
jgi:predicted phosphodiesterase